MKIGIDISQIVHGTGVSFYTRNLVRALAEIDKENDYLLIGTSRGRYQFLADFGTEINKINPLFLNRFFRWPVSLAEIWANRWRFGSLEKLVGPMDIFHSSDWLQPPCQAVKVTTIHDFGFWRYPQTAHRKIRSVMKRRLLLVKKEVDKIICVSRATAKDAVQLLKVPPEKIEVIFEAPGLKFRKVPISKVAKIKDKYEIKGDYFLAVATIEPRKNFGGILEAVAPILKKKPNLSLVVVGRLGWDKLMGRIMSQTDRVNLVGYIPTSDLVALYNGSLGLIYPSLYEGFGLPVLEAFACGCPVVTSNISSLPEIAGRSAVLVNPLKAEEIGAGIKQVLAKREELIRRGFERVKKFSWKKTAEQTLALYEKTYRAFKN
ncbi:MAG: glycosyltransferase family 4 protein [Candidatus Pacebacteria bacterium]|nr:glycosyltransferase family 4 protein [Candidatus Paceibacterota bacterium]